MSQTDQKTNGFNPFDPSGMLKDMRNAGMDTWSKMMLELVHTDAYAEATGTMLDAWLSSSAPFRKAMEKSTSESLSNLNLPTRDDFIRLAEQLTHIEMRLDDMEAKLDECLKANSPKKAEEKSE